MSSAHVTRQVEHREIAPRAVHAADSGVGDRVNVSPRVGVHFERLRHRGRRHACELLIDPHGTEDLEQYGRTATTGVCRVVYVFFLLYLLYLQFIFATKFEKPIPHRPHIAHLCANERNAT